MKCFQTVELTCGDRGEDPIRNMWFYTKVYPNKAMKISKEQVLCSIFKNEIYFYIRFRHFYHKHFVNMIFVFIVKIGIQIFVQLFVLVLNNFVQPTDIQFPRYFVKINCVLVAFDHFWGVCVVFYEQLVISFFILRLDASNRLY